MEKKRKPKAMEEEEEIEEEKPKSKRTKQEIKEVRIILPSGEVKRVGSGCTLDELREYLGKSSAWYVRATGSSVIHISKNTVLCEKEYSFFDGTLPVSNSNDGPITRRGEEETWTGKARVFDLLKNVPSASEYSKGDWRTRKDLAACVAVHRPHSGFPVVLLDTILATLYLDLWGAYEPTRRDCAAAMALMDLLSKGFDDENKAMHPKVKEWATKYLDWGITTESNLSNAKWTLINSLVLNLEMKKEKGSGGGSSYMQSIAYYMRNWNDPVAYKVAVETHCPSILVEITGPEISVNGAVFTDQGILCDPFITASLVKNIYDYKHLVTAARILGAVTKAALALEHFYRCTREAIIARSVNQTNTDTNINASVGSAPAGSRPNTSAGRASVGKALVGKASVGRASTSAGSASAGSTSAGSTSAGSASVGSSSAGSSSVGSSSAGSTSVGSTSVGSTSARSTSNKLDKFIDGKIAAYSFPNFRTIAIEKMQNLHSLKNIPSAQTEAHIEYTSVISRLVFIANLSGPFDTIQVVVKFTNSYCEEAHKICEEAGCAPKLYFVGEVNRFKVIVMEHIKDAEAWCNAAVKTKKNAFPHVKDTVFALHAKDFVHGDLRTTNILFAGTRVAIIDFDWSGKAGEQRYPYFMNHETLRWPDGAEDGKTLEKKHDLEWIRNNFCGIVDEKELV